MADRSRNNKAYWTQEGEPDDIMRPGTIVEVRLHDGTMRVGEVVMASRIYVHVKFSALDDGWSFPRSRVLESPFKFMTYA